MKIKGNKTYDQIHNKYSVDHSRNIGNKQLPQKGEVLKGEVIDLNQNAIRIRLTNGEMIEARMTEVFDFFIGQQLEFMVRDASNEQLLLSPLLNEENMILDKLVQILKDAGINVNSTNVSIVNRLLENNLPVDKESLIHFIKLTKKHPYAKTDELIFFLKNKIPITETNILQLQKIQNGQAKLGNSLLSLADELTLFSLNEQGEEYIEIALRGNQKAQEILQSIKAFIKPLILNPDDELLSVKQEELVAIESAVENDNKFNENIKPNTHFSNLRLKLSQPLGELLTSSEIKTLEYKINMAIFNKSDMIKFDGKTVAELFDIPNILKLSDSLTDEINRILGKEITKNILANEIFMDIKDIENPEKLNLYYNELKDKIEDLIELEKKSIVDYNKPLPKDVKTIQDSIEFMKDMNQKFNYLQLPILLGDKPLNCDLYVMNNKKAKSDKDVTSAFIRLDMVNLGLLDIFVTKTDKDLQIQFYTVDEARRILLQDKIYGLHNALQKSGFYIRGISVVKKEKEIDVMKNFLERDKDTNEVKRYTFDMRV